MDRIRAHCRTVIRNLPTHPVMGQIRSLGLRTVAVTGITCTILVPVFADKYPSTLFHHMLIQCFLCATASVYLGFIYEHTSIGAALEVFGLTGMLVAACLTLTTILKMPAVLTPWLVAIVVLTPLLEVIMNPRRGAPTADPVQQSN